MTEHINIVNVDWPKGRDARRALAKRLGYTGVAAERAYKAQKEALKPKRGHLRKVAQDSLPTADFVGDRPPPVSVVVKDAAGDPCGGGAVAVEDLEHEYNLRELVLRQARELRIAQDVILEDGRRLNAARIYMLKLENYSFDMQFARDDWRTTLELLVLGASVACLQAGGLWIALAVGAICTAAYHHYKDHQQDAARPVNAPWMHPTVPKPVRACTDDICGCGHAPSSPFNIPGVLPETPQVVVGDNDKETK